MMRAGVSSSALGNFEKSELDGLANTASNRAEPDRRIVRKCRPARRWRGRPCRACIRFPGAPARLSQPGSGRAMASLMLSRFAAAAIAAARQRCLASSRLAARSSARRFRMMMFGAIRFAFFDVLIVFSFLFCAIASIASPFPSQTWGLDRWRGGRAELRLAGTRLPFPPLSRRAARCPRAVSNGDPFSAVAANARRFGLPSH